METKVFSLKDEKQHEQGMEIACEVIRAGGLVIFPTETVYGLGADAMNAEAVRSIFAAKGRPADNPLIVHISKGEQLYELTHVTELAKKLADKFWPGPLTLVLEAKDCVPSVTRGGLSSVGVRMPESEYARELISRSGRFIAAPSANISGRPSPTKAEHVEEDFMGKVPVVLDGGEVRIGVESTVVDARGEIPVVLRPGGITVEMLNEAAGDAKVAKAVLSGLDDGECAPSPGMRYQHYSPEAKVYVVEGENAEAIAFKINSLYDKDIELGKRPLVLCSYASLRLYNRRNAVSLGATKEQIAAHIFDAMRTLEADVIYFEAVDTDGIGLAVMNRMIRAAGFDVI